MPHCLYTSQTPGSVCPSYSGISGFRNGLNVRSYNSSSWTRCGSYRFGLSLCIDSFIWKIAPNWSPGQRRKWRDYRLLVYLQWCHELISDPQFLQRQNKLQNPFWQWNIITKAKRSYLLCREGCIFGNIYNSATRIVWCKNSLIQ